MTWQPVDGKTPHDRPIMVKGGYVIVMPGYLDGSPLEGVAIVKWVRAYKYSRYGVWVIPHTQVQITAPQYWREIPE